MKKYLIFLMTAAAVFVSCGQDNLLPEDETIQQTPITFNLTANHPDATKAVKTGWEEGDAIFVFFNNVAAPKHLKMTYNGASWASAEYNGATQTDGALGLKNGDTGTMRAVFLPFPRRKVPERAKIALQDRFCGIRSFCHTAMQISHN